jgi:hypothetical protein
VIGRAPGIPRPVKLGLQPATPTLNRGRAVVLKILQDLGPGGDSNMRRRGMRRLSWAGTTPATWTFNVKGIPAPLRGDDRNGQGDGPTRLSRAGVQGQ